MTANTRRGEAILRTKYAAFMLRPSFAALCAAEEELGPLFALVERAVAGELKLAEMIALFWYCLVERHGMERADFGEAVAEAGLAGATPVLKIILGQILGGR